MAAIQGDICWKRLQRHKLHSHSLCSLIRFQVVFLVYKRGKNTPYLGAFHSFDILEFYGIGFAPDFIGTDALGMSCYRLSAYSHAYSVNFVNTGNHLESLLSAVDWQPWNSCVEHPLLTFLNPAPNVSITFDTYRVDAMNLLNNILAGVGSSLIRGSFIALR
jgi:acetylcholinesterase